jgi:hypothetical protein
MILALVLATSPLISMRWQLVEKQDPITDSREVSLAVGNDNRVLLFSCDADSKKIRTGASSSDWLGGKPNQARKTTYRIDNGKPMDDIWFYGGRSAWSLDAISTTRILAANFSVTIRLSTADGGFVDVVFNMTDGKKERDSFRAKCAAIGIPIR